MQATEVSEGRGTKMCSDLMAEFIIGITSRCKNTNDTSSLMCLLPRGLLISLYYNLLRLLSSLLLHFSIASNILTSPALQVAIGILSINSPLCPYSFHMFLMQHGDDAHTITISPVNINDNVKPHQKSQVLTHRTPNPTLNRMYTSMDVTTLHPLTRC